MDYVGHAQRKTCTDGATLKKERQSSTAYLHVLCGKGSVLYVMLNGMHRVELICGRQYSG